MRTRLSILPIKAPGITCGVCYARTWRTVRNTEDGTTYRVPSHGRRAVADVEGIPHCRTCLARAKREGR